MNRGIPIFLIFSVAAISVLTLLDGGCSSPSEPNITPPQPSFTAPSIPPNPVDSRIYGDAGPVDAIDVQWNPDSSGNTSGYLLFRSMDDTVGSDGLLKNRITVAQLESTDQLIQPLPTLFRDTTGITDGATYWYQLQAYYRSPNNNLDYSLPTHVDITTSFNYQPRDVSFSPTGAVSLQGLPLKFLWDEPGEGGDYQIIVQRLDNFTYPYSALVEDFDDPVTEEYPTDSTAAPLAAGVPYRWRVKKIVQYGGSSSEWLTFTVTP